jgi:bifunctional DNA-binding transcriptional regulator/antitoxin component of YhaV-PrlF toxin-antitoxin module
MNKWTIVVEEDKETGELLLPFSDELLEQVGWKIGDTIEWIDNKDGTWTMRKKDEITKTD